MLNTTRTVWRSIALTLGVSWLLAGCSSLRPAADAPRPASQAIPSRPEILGDLLKKRVLGDGQSAFVMLANGVDGLAARLELIGAARASLDLQYYIFRADISGSLLAKALLKAADRGVRIRILVDDGESVAGDERLFALAAHPSVQIRVFNPFDYRGHNRAARAIDFVLHKRRLDHRMHNKLLVADNAIAVVGGRNLGDQYFQIAPDSQFGDDDVLTVGPLVPRLSGVFDQFWNHPLATPVQSLEPGHASERALATFRAATPAIRPRNAFDNDLSRRLDAGEPLAGVLDGRTPLSAATAQVVYDSPDKARVHGAPPREAIYSEVEARAMTVTTELLMITPYFVPSPRQLELLEELCRRGVRVRALTNSLEATPDVVAQAGYGRYRKALLEAGVQLYEIRARVQGQKGTGQPQKLSRHGNYALHAKLYVFDRQSLFVGSMNFDQRSEHLNTEIGLLINSPQLAVNAAKRFDSLTQLRNAYTVELRAAPDAPAGQLVWETETDGVKTQSTREPARSAWQRFKMQVLSWLPIDREL